MPFVFKDVDSLRNHELVGGGDCVELIKKYIPALAGKSARTDWRPGERVIDAKNLQRGTAIATFIDGRYPGLPRGNHAAFYLATSGAGFYAMDQWKSKLRVNSRRIEPGRMDSKGVIWTSLSDSAEAFYVIEL